MKIFNKIGDTFSQTVDVIVEKNRQAAYINRLKAIILSEQERINKAYIVLGKEFIRNKEGRKSSGFDPDEIIEEIAAAKLRLKKARARYEYTIRYGIPKPGIKAEEVVEAEVGCDLSDDDKDEQDITIAYADPSADDSTLDAAIDECIDKKDE